MTIYNRFKLVDGKKVPMVHKLRTEPILKTPGDIDYDGDGYQPTVCHTQIVWGNVTTSENWQDVTCNKCLRTGKNNGEV